MHARVVVGVGKGVLFREVSSVQECPHRERGSTVYHMVYFETGLYTMNLSLSILFRICIRWSLVE